MLDRIVEFTTRYNMFTPGQSVGVAVSGGADSVCLLHVLAELAPRWALRLTVLHLNHMLRGAESDADAEFVAGLARQLGIGFVLQKADVARVAEETGDNLEQAGRQVRRKWLLSLGFDRIALGHSRNDQAETVLLRLLRGSGTTGLAGMQPVTSEGLVRPLLELSRREIEAWLRERAIQWREDSSNRDLRFTRNRLRRQLLPALLRDWNPNLVDALARTATMAAEDEDYWKTEIEPQISHQDSEVFLELGSFCQLPRALARRLARRAIELAKGDLRGIEFEHVEGVMRLAESLHGHGRFQIPGLDVLRSFDRIRLAPRRPDGLEGRNWRLAVEAPGEIQVPGTSLTLVLELSLVPDETCAVPARYNEGVSELDWDLVPGPLELRNWRPGDQYHRPEQAHPEKLKILFQEARVPLWERRNWPILTSGDQVIWTRRFGVAAKYAAGPGTRRVLRIREKGV